jgi:metal-dependent HD superfamily phosphatase/phosphodiesterase
MGASDRKNGGTNGDAERTVDVRIEPAPNPADDPRVRQRQPGEATLRIDLAGGRTADLDVPANGAAKQTTGAIPAAAHGLGQEPAAAPTRTEEERPVQFATPRAKLIVEADAAIRADLSRFPRALAAYDALAHDEEARANWDMANYITVRKLGYNDHGRVHAWVTGAASLAILELLVAAGIRPDVMESGIGDLDDTYVVVLLGTMLHDIGNLVHRHNHEGFGVVLARPIIDRILAGLYESVDKRTKIRSFILHSINCHDLDPAPLTLEGGITAVADGTDITKGRGRKAFSLGSVDIHSISALAVEQVTIARGIDRPVEIAVSMNNSAGIFQVEETLARKVIATPLEPYVSLTARTQGDLENGDQRIVHSVSLLDGRFVNMHRPNGPAQGAKRLTVDGKGY